MNNETIMYPLESAQPVEVKAQHVAAVVEQLKSSMGESQALILIFSDGKKATVAISGNQSEIARMLKAALVKSENFQEVLEMAIDDIVKGMTKHATR